MGWLVGRYYAVTSELLVGCKGVDWLLRQLLNCSEWLIGQYKTRVFLVLNI